jgi:hypothetical protein
MWNSNQFNGGDKVQELSSQREISKILQVGSKLSYALLIK